MVQDSRMLMQGLVTLVSNSAAYLGGAMYLGPVSSTVEVLVTFNNLDMQKNEAELSGGAIFSSRSLTFNAHGHSILHGNKAGGKGGAIALFENEIILRQGHTMEVVHNEAGAHGGGLALLSGAWISISDDDRCSTECAGASRGNSICDPQCLNRACNWDHGDCNVRFRNAGREALESCDRHVNACTFLGQASAMCNGACFSASCDYSKQGCAPEKAHLKTCPLLEAKVYSSLKNIAPSLRFLMGGTSQGYGTCSESVCNLPVPAPNASELKGPGRIGASALLLDHGSWLNLASLDDAFSAAPSSHFTVEAWTKVGCQVQAEEASRVGNASQLSFIWAGENLAIALLTDRITCFAWPLVFAGAAPGACSAQNVVLLASTGRIGDGPGMLSRTQPPCSWIVAPPNAASVTLVFTEFFLVQETGQSFVDTLSICVCADVKCLVPNSCSRFSGSNVPPSFTSTTGIMRVILETSTSSSFPSAPGFMAAYAAAYDSVRIDAELWHHLALTIEPALGNNSGSLLHVYLDGMVSFIHVLTWDPAHAAPFAGEFGVAIGRGAPHWQPAEREFPRESLDYPTRKARSSMSLMGRNLGQFNGSIDEVRVWRTRRSSLEINASKELTCSDLNHDLVACYSFDHTSDGDTHFEDESARGLVTAQSASGLSPHLPWCISRQDEGQVHLTSLNATAWIPASWGFCSNKPRLPGAGYVYDVKQMQDLAAGLGSASQALLLDYPGCGHLPLNVSHNSAVLNGGAFYVDSCERQGRCFVRGLEPASGSRAAMLHHNIAQGGGGAVFVGCNTLGSTCLKTFDQHNTLGVLPHLPKFSVKHNHGAYGNDFASNPAYLQVVDVGLDFTVVPGQQRLELSVLAMDSSLNRCTNLEDVVQVLICRKNDACSKNTAVNTVNFYNSAPKSGVFHIVQEFQCPVVDEQTLVSSPFIHGIIQISMVRYDSIEKLNILVRCGWCRKGESRNIGYGVQTWTCEKCGANQYVMDPNNVAHGCKDCPAQASCDDGSLNPLVGDLKTHWKADTVSGVYTLQGCLAGYSLLKGLCIVCKPRTYCQGDASAALACPTGTHSASASTSAENCIEVETVVLILKIPMSLAQFNEIEDIFREAIAGAASTNASNVMVVSVRQIASRRSRWRHDFSYRGEQGADRRDVQDEKYRTKSLPQSLIEVEIAAAKTLNVRTMMKRLDAENINRHLQVHGLPEAQIVSKPQLSSEIGDMNSSLRREHIALIVSGFVFFCCVGVFFLWWWTSTTVQLDEREIALRKMVSIVRDLLGMTRQHGFFLSNETPTFWERCHGNYKRSVVVEKRNMEELARMQMMQDFEISNVDALVIFLSDLPCYTATVASDPLSLAMDQEDPETPPARQRRQTNSTFNALRTFLLHTSQHLLSSEFLQRLDEINVTTEELEAHGIHIPCAYMLNGQAALGHKERSVKYSKMMETETIAKADCVFNVPLGAVEMSVSFFHS